MVNPLQAIKAWEEEREAVEAANAAEQAAKEAAKAKVQSEKKRTNLVLLGRIWQKLSELFGHHKGDESVAIEVRNRGLEKVAELLESIGSPGDIERIQLAAYEQESDINRNLEAELTIVEKHRDELIDLLRDALQQRDKAQEQATSHKSRADHLAKDLKKLKTEHDEARQALAGYVQADKKQFKDLLVIEETESDLRNTIEDISNQRDEAVKAAAIAQAEQDTAQGMQRDLQTQVDNLTRELEDTKLELAQANAPKGVTAGIKTRLARGGVKDTIMPRRQRGDEAVPGETIEKSQPSPSGVIHSSPVQTHRQKSGGIMPPRRKVGSDS